MPYNYLVDSTLSSAFLSISTEVPDLVKLRFYKEDNLEEAPTCHRALSKADFVRLFLGLTTVNLFNFAGEISAYAMHVLSDKNNRDVYLFRMSFKGNVHYEFRVPFRRIPDLF